MATKGKTGEDTKTKVVKKPATVPRFRSKSEVLKRSVSFWAKTQNTDPARVSAICALRKFSKTTLLSKEEFDQAVTDAGNVIIR